MTSSYAPDQLRWAHRRRACCRLHTDIWTQTTENSSPHQTPSNLWNETADVNATEKKVPATTSILNALHLIQVRYWSMITPCHQMYSSISKSTRVDSRLRVDSQAVNHIYLMRDRKWTRRWDWASWSRCASRSWSESCPGFRRSCGPATATPAASRTNNTITQRRISDREGEMEGVCRHNDQWCCKHSNPKCGLLLPWEHASSK